MGNNYINYNEQPEEDIVNVLMAISVVSKRLARNITIMRQRAQEESELAEAVRESASQDFDDLEALRIRLGLSRRKPS